MDGFAVITVLLAIMLTGFYKLPTSRVLIRVHEYNKLPRLRGRKATHVLKVCTDLEQILSSLVEFAPGEICHEDH